MVLQSRQHCDGDEVAGAAQHGPSGNLCLGKAPPITRGIRSVRRVNRCPALGACITDIYNLI